MDRNSRKEISAGFVLSYLTMIVQLATGLLYTPIVLKSLGQGQFGVYSLVISFIGYLTILNAGVNGAYIRFYVHARTTGMQRTSDLNGLFLKIFSFLSVIALIASLVLGYLSPYLFGSRITDAEYELMQRCFYILAFIVCAEVINCPFSSLIIANEKFIFNKLFSIVTAVLKPSITIPFLLWGKDCTAILLVQLFVDLVILAGNYLYCRMVLKVQFSKGTFEKTFIRNIMQFILFIALQSIMDQLNWQIDKFILARVSGSAEVSIYSVGSTFNGYYITIGSVLGTVFITQVNKIVAGKDMDGLNELFVKTTRLSAYGVWLIMIMYTFLGRAFIHKWAGMEYDLSFFVGWMLMFPVTFSLMLALGTDIARAENKHQLQIVINVAVCILNTIVSIPLAMKYGALGSALGTLIADIIICCIIQPIYYHKVLSLNIIKVIKEVVKMIPALIPPCIYGGVVYHFKYVEDRYISILLHGIIITGIYCAGAYFLAMNEKEKQMIHRIKNKILGDLHAGKKHTGL